MYDGTTQMFEMLKRPDTVQVIPVIGDKIMIADEQQPGGAWNGLGLFGGRVDEGEEPLAAAKRELLEEAGLESDDWDLYKSYDPHRKFEWQVHYYIARNCKKVAEPSPDAGEKIEIKPVSFDEFVAAVTGPDLREGEFTSDILRLKLEGRLEEFKKKLWEQAT